MPVPATPHAEGGEKKGVYHGAELHNVHYFVDATKVVINEQKIWTTMVKRTVKRLLYSLDGPLSIN